MRWKDLAAETGLFTNTWEDADNLDFCTNLWRLSSFLLVADSQCVLEYCCQNLSGEPWSGHCSTCNYMYWTKDAAGAVYLQAKIIASNEHVDSFPEWRCLCLPHRTNCLKKGSSSKASPENLSSKRSLEYRFGNHFAHHISLMSTCPKFPHETTGHAFVVFPKALPLKVATSWTDWHKKNHAAM